METSPAPSPSSAAITPLTATTPTVTTTVTPVTGIGIGIGIGGGSLATLPPSSMDTPRSISMRGRKKHLCSVCGNIAKSRCPFNCCKGCCVKSKNLCHIHVIKPGGETPPSVASTPPPHPPAVSSIVRHAHVNDNLRLRTVKPMGLITRKEAAFINHLRFQKLKNFTESIIEDEDQAFDRYMQNVSLLEAIFTGDSQNLEGLSSDGHLLIENASGNDQSDAGGAMNVASLIAGFRVRMKTSLKRRESHKQKLRRAIDRSLQKLYNGDQIEGMSENEVGLIDVRRDKKRIKVQSIDGKERLRKMDVFNSITEKVKQAENPEDYNSCLKIFEENFIKKELRPALTRGEVTTGDSKLTLGSMSNEESSQELPLHDKGSDVFGLGAFTKARIDAYGVLKSWWKVDLPPGSLDFYANDMPVVTLESL